MTKLNKMEQVVLAAIMLHPKGATQDEIAAAIKPQFPDANFTARIPALKRKNLVVDTGEKRPGVLGRNQSVLKATAFSQQ